MSTRLSMEERRAAMAVARFAVDLTGLVVVPASSSLNEVKELVQEPDEQEAGGGLETFARARAAFAVEFAMDADADVAVQEATYRGGRRSGGYRACGAGGDDRARMKLQLQHHAIASALAKLHDEGDGSSWRNAATTVGRGLMTAPSQAVSLGSRPPYPRGVGLAQAGDVASGAVISHSGSLC